jgi:Zn-dependent membrane protease YugP
MPVILLLLILAALVFGPQLYVRHVLEKYSRPDERFPGSGGELARHLLARFRLDGVRVEATEQGDHYDPASRSVRLSRDNLEGKSLTAIAVAAHEVGHAIQHHHGYPLFEVRTRLVRVATLGEKVGVVAMLAMPLLTILGHSPVIALVSVTTAVLAFFGATLVHLVTLPVEWDASFGRALPILVEGQYINRREERAVRRILRAAALTYVAASLVGLLNLGRWMAILRR